MDTLLCGRILAHMPEAIMKRIYVGNLGTNTIEEELRKWFEVALPRTSIFH